MYSILTRLKIASLFESLWINRRTNAGYGLGRGVGASTGPFLCANILQYTLLKDVSLALVRYEVTLGLCGLSDPRKATLKNAR